MNVISAACTPCVGVCCPIRQVCEHYAAVDGHEPDPKTWGTCETRQHSFPMFMAKRPVQVKACAA